MIPITIYYTIFIIIAILIISSVPSRKWTRHSFIFTVYYSHYYDHYHHSYNQWCGEQKMDALATGPAPGLGEKSAVLTAAVQRGPAGKAAADAMFTHTPAHGPAPGSPGWRVDDFRLTGRPRYQDEKMPSVRSQLEEAGAGRLSARGSVAPAAREGGGSSHRSAQSTDGAPTSMAEWAERNALVPSASAPASARGGQGSTRSSGAVAARRGASPDDLSHPGLV